MKTKDLIHLLERNGWKKELPILWRNSLKVLSWN